MSNEMAEYMWKQCQHTCQIKCRNLNQKVSDPTDNKYGREICFNRLCDYGHTKENIVFTCLYYILLLYTHILHMLYIDTIQIVRQNERKLTKPEQIKVGGDHIKKCNFTFFFVGV